MGRVVKVLLIFSVIANVTWSSIIDNRIDKYIVSDGCKLSEAIKTEIQEYQEIVDKIIREIVNGRYAGDTFNSLQDMTDKFGPRPSGSKALDDAIDFMVDEFKRAGLENVHTEEAEVPHWVRGFEYAEMTAPRKAELKILGLGTSIGTPRGGIIGDAVVVESFDELASLPTPMVTGKIVVFAPSWQGYGKTVQYRSIGAAAAAKKGAIASLIRSATPFSIGSPHTGVQDYEDGVKKIPTACITVEDAMLLLRLYRKGERITIRIEMDDRNLEPVISRNTIGELVGTENRSVVVVSGHLDSWDVGVGAMDDGGGAYISWKAVQYLKAMGLRPRRTIRSILWTGEEYGYLGARAYQKKHADNEKNEFNIFLESDIGTFDPLGLSFTGNKDAECIFKEVLKLMTALNATQFSKPSDGGPDISLWVDRGFPGASLINKNEKYFWFHHSAGDSMLVEDPTSLDKCTALFAAAAFVIADLSVDIPKNVD